MKETAMFSLAEISRIQAAERPQKPALICDDRTMTYGELDAESSQVAQALIESGVGSQDRVGFIGKNVPEYFTLFFGAAKVNAVTVAVNWRLAPPEMAYILEQRRGESCPRRD
ncbi:MAG: AMP-binding protein [Acidimicrobiales bacterium]